MNLDAAANSLAAAAPPDPQLRAAADAAYAALLTAHAAPLDAAARQAAYIAVHTLHAAVRQHYARTAGWLPADAGTANYVSDLILERGGLPVPPRARGRLHAQLWALRDESGDTWTH